MSYDPFQEENKKIYKLFELVKPKKTTTKGPTAITENNATNCNKVCIIK